MLLLAACKPKTGLAAAPGRAHLPPRAAVTAAASAAAVAAAAGGRKYEGRVCKWKAELEFDAIRFVDVSCTAGRGPGPGPTAAARGGASGSYQRPCTVRGAACAAPARVPSAPTTAITRSTLAVGRKCSWVTQSAHPPTQPRAPSASPPTPPLPHTSTLTAAWTL